LTIGGRVFGIFRIGGPIHPVIIKKENMERGKKYEINPCPFIRNTP